MFKNFNLITGIFALAMFGYAQHQGWNLFDNVANPGSGGSGAAAGFITSEINELCACCLIIPLCASLL